MAPRRPLLGARSEDRLCAKRPNPPCVHRGLRSVAALHGRLRAGTDRLSRVGAQRSTHGDVRRGAGVVAPTRAAAQRGTPGLPHAAARPAPIDRGRERGLARVATSRRCDTGIGGCSHRGSYEPRPDDSMVLMRAQRRQRHDPSRAPSGSPDPQPSPRIGAPRSLLRGDRNGGADKVLAHVGSQSRARQGEPRGSRRRARR